MKKVNRRDFLKGATAAVTVSVVPAQVAGKVIPTTAEAPEEWMKINPGMVEVEIGGHTFEVPIHYYAVEIGGKTVLRQEVSPHPLVKKALEEGK